MSQSGIKMRSKIRKIANYLTFYAIISIVAFYEPIYLTLNNISENKNFVFSKSIKYKEENLCKIMGDIAKGNGGFNVRWML